MAVRILAIPLILLTLCGGRCGGSTAEADASGRAAPIDSARSPAIPVADLTNAERRRAGLTAVALSPKLNLAAQLQADQLASQHVLEHEVRGGRYPTPGDRLTAAGYSWRAYGENIASGQPTAAAVVAAWMNSPAHRANILNPSFTDVGTGYATDNTGRPYWVQLFGRPR